MALFCSTCVNLESGHCQEHTHKKAKLFPVDMSERRKWLNPLLWVVALLIVNLLWQTVSQQVAPNEINNPQQFEAVRQVNISPVFGQETPMPAVLVVGFESSVLEEGNISISIWLNNQTLIFSWSGHLSDEPPSWTGTLQPGEYTIITDLDDGIEITQTLHLKPFATIQYQGHFVLSGCLVIIAFAENMLRLWLASRERTTQVPKAVAPFTGTAFHDEEGVPANVDSPWRDPLR